MKLEVLRYQSGKDSTLSLLFDASDGQRIFLCYGLEDEYRVEKVRGETRIPAGLYELVLRTEGGHHKRYAQKFPDFHKGMLWVRSLEPDREVPNFKWILWHIGNDDDDTDGCLLLGSTPTEDMRVLRSTKAYKRVYKYIVRAMEVSRERVFVEYIDYDTVTP